MLDPGIVAVSASDWAPILNVMSELPQLEYLQPPVRADGPIRLADPDPGWAAHYAQEEQRIRAAWAAGDAG